MDLIFSLMNESKLKTRRRSNVGRENSNRRVEVTCRIAGNVAPTTQSDNDNTMTSLIIGGLLSDKISRVDTEKCF